MKKYQYILFIMIGVFLFASCDGNEMSKNMSIIDSTENDYRIFETGEGTAIYTVDEDNNLYYNTHRTIEEKSLEDNGEEVIHKVDRSYISKYDIDGVLVSSYEGYLPNQPIIHMGKIYGTKMVRDEKYELIEKELISIPENNEDINKDIVEPRYIESILSEIPGFTNIYKLGVIDNKVYILGVHNDYLEDSFSSMRKDDSYLYSGCKIGLFDKNTSQWGILDIEYPISMDTTYDNRLLIYAYDKVNGYYFTYYDPSTAQYTEPLYSNIRYLDNFEIQNDGNDFVYIEWNSNKISVVSSNPINTNIKSEILPVEMISKYDIRATKDFTYFLDGSKKNIIRIKNSAYIRANKSIVTLNRLNISYMAPFGMGYSFLTQEKSKDEIALAVLSNDDSFDIFQLHSTDDISHNIKENGVFYPLNNVPGIKEYLDACFPYIKDAATTKDGEVWMLPIFVDIPTYIYNESFCDEREVEFNKNIDLHTFLNAVYQAGSSSETKELYLSFKEDIVQNVLQEYIHQNKDLDTEEFRKLAFDLKYYVNSEVDPSIGRSMLNADYTYSKSRNFLFLNQRNTSNLLNFKTDNILNAMSIPSIYNNKTRIASCYYLAVNPASKNLNDTLNYISSLSRYLLKDKNYIMLHDRNHYVDSQIMDDLYEIYSNGEIQFTLNHEIYLEDFKKYLRDELDLDTYIMEANRKLEIYLNE